MDERRITSYILEAFDGVQVAEDEGNLFFYYDNQNRIPFATILTSNKYDAYSELDRPGVFRLSIGTGKATYRAMFPVEKIPTEAGYDFTALDVLMPHPAYGRVYWVCVLNPSEATFDRLRPMLAEAYEIAVRKFTAVHAAKGR